MPYCEQQEKIRHIVIFPFPKKIQIIHMFLKTNVPNHQKKTYMYIIVQMREIEI